MTSGRVVVVGDDVETAVAGCLRDLGAVAHRLEEMGDEVLELHPPKALRSTVNNRQLISNY